MDSEIAGVRRTVTNAVPGIRSSFMLTLPGSNFAKPGVTAATASVSAAGRFSNLLTAKDSFCFATRRVARAAGLRGRFKRSLQILETLFLLGRRLRSRIIEFMSLSVAYSSLPESLLFQ